MIGTVGELVFLVERVHGGSFAIVDGSSIVFVNRKLPDPLDALLKANRFELWSYLKTRQYLNAVAKDETFRKDYWLAHKMVKERLQRRLERLGKTLLRGGESIQALKPSRVGG